MNIEFDSSELRLFVDDEAIRLHPLWMRERSKEETAVDQRSFQRLYDPETLEDNLTFADAKQLDQDEILIKFSDQHEAKYSLKDLLLEVGRKDNLPQKILWNTDNLEFKEFSFDYGLEAEMQMLEILEDISSLRFSENVCSLANLMNKTILISFCQFCPTTKDSSISLISSTIL